MNPKKIKFEWRYRYVAEGQLMPDAHNRWALDCYVFVNIEKALPNYKWAKHLTADKKHLPCRMAIIEQKGTRGSVVPANIRFGCSLPSVEDAGNTGFANQSFMFSNDLEELKAKVENRITGLVLAFTNIQYDV